MPNPRPDHPIIRPSKRGPTMAFRVVAANQVHTRLDVFVGSAYGNRALAGTITVPTDELKDLVDNMQMEMVE